MRKKFLEGNRRDTCLMCVVQMKSILWRNRVIEKLLGNKIITEKNVSNLCSFLNIPPLCPCCIFLFAYVHMRWRVSMWFPTNDINLTWHPSKKEPNILSRFLSGFTSLRKVNEFVLCMEILRDHISDRKALCLSLKQRNAMVIQSCMND